MQHIVKSRCRCTGQPVTLGEALYDLGRELWMPGRAVHL
jgi:hypothetical protein